MAKGYNVGFFKMFKYKNKATFPVIFVVDSSDVMTGDRMLGSLIRYKTIIRRFTDYNKNEANEVNIKIAILTFSSNSRWITKLS